MILARHHHGLVFQQCMGHQALYPLDNRADHHVQVSLAQRVAQYIIHTDGQGQGDVRRPL
ncbi:hypothetical protein D3C78_1688420 [compost metagenome]